MFLKPYFPAITEPLSLNIQSRSSNIENLSNGGFQVHKKIENKGAKTILYPQRQSLHTFTRTKQNNTTALANSQILPTHETPHAINVDHTLLQ
jgi:hypothetical protein